MFRLSTNQRGVVFVEVVYVLMLLLSFIYVVREFSVLSGDAHLISSDLLNRIDSSMIALGKPACLFNEIGREYFEKESEKKFFKNQSLSKRIYFVKGSVCED